jgi:hypothetical protein
VSVIAGAAAASRAALTDKKVGYLIEPYSNCGRDAYSGWSGFETDCRFAMSSDAMQQQG